MEAFMKIATESLQHYPDDMLRYLADPKTGIVTKSTFLPSVAEMRRYMDEEWERRRDLDRLEQKPAPRLPEPEIDPRVRRRVAAGFKDLLTEIRPRGATTSRTLSKIEEKEAAEAWLAREAHRAASQPPIKLSASAIKILFED